MAVAVAESNLACSPRPSTSLAGLMRLHRSSVRDLSVRGSWMMMPLIVLSTFARIISSRSASPPPVATGAVRSPSPCQAPDLLEEIFAQISITLIPISLP